MKFEFDLFEFIKDLLILGTFIYCTLYCKSEYVFTYVLLTGIISSGYFVFYIQNQDSWHDKVRDLVWNTGLDENFHEWIAFIMCFILGFYLLPSKIIRCLFSTIKGDKDE